MEKENKKQAYVKGLRGQITDVAERKRYGVLMTEHERMTNDRDIQAYENMESKLSTKLPGFGGSYEAEKQKNMVERAFGNSPAQYSKKADVYIGPGLSKQPNTHSAPYLTGVNDVQPSAGIS